MKLSFHLRFIVFILIFSSCDKDENKIEEKPFLALLNQPSIVIDTAVAAVDWVYGFKFTPLKDGKITGVGMKLPIEGSYKVQLWDLDNDILLKEETISSTTPHDVVFNNISEVQVSKNKTLGISIEADSFYKISKADNSDFNFPMQEGNISILSFHEIRVADNTGNKFPLATNDAKMSPCVDIIFIAE